MEAKQRETDGSTAENLSGLYYDLAYNAIYAQAFAEAEQHARKAIEQAPDMPLFVAPLPIALLFQDKFEEASELYLQWKDQMVDDERGRQVLLKEVFLEDLLNLEEAGIAHPALEQARALLNR